MKPLACTLICHSNSPHLQQIYTGFYLLHKQGVLRIKQIIDKSLRKSRSSHAHLKVNVDGRINLFYDTRDGQDIDEAVLASVDFYFKRSYADTVAGQLVGGEKVLPLGLNYGVYSNDIDRHHLQRALLGTDFKDTAKQALIAARLNQFAGMQFAFANRLHQLEQYPDYDAAPEALFIARTWDPRANKQRSPEKIAEIEQMNETRAACIRLLRQNFGRHFFGGFVHDDYASRHFHDCLLPHKHLSKPPQYLKLLKKYPIGVATTGLHGSIGWKLAEYVAHAKAVVSEQLTFQVPGDFAPEQNYLAFASPEAAVAQVMRLFDDQDLRYRLMHNNYQYYHAFLRPDALVLHSLLRALGEFVGEPEPSDM
jgi:hypothetical protein